MLTSAEIMSYVCSHPNHSKLAVLGTSTDETLPFYSGIEGEQVFEQPVANILHEVNKVKKPRSQTMYLSYPPSELELGMLWRAKISGVYFAKNLDLLEIGRYRVTQDGCELLETSDMEAIPMDEEARKKLETQETRLKTAMEAPIAERKMSSALTEALQRGLPDAQTPDIEDERSDTKIDEDFIRIVLALVDRSWNSKDGTIKPLDRVAGNNIGAIMVDKNNKIIGWGLNYKGNNKTLHAETMMIQHYLRENETDKLPEGAKIYTSLQCCHMCAGHIATLGENIKVVYAQRDPFFNGETAISESVAVNNCRESATTLPIHEVFASQVGQQEILDFLFGLHPDAENYPDRTMPTRELFARTLRDVDLFNELAAVVQARNASVLKSDDSDEDDLVDEQFLSSRSDNSSDESLGTYSDTSSTSTIIEAGEEFLDALGDIAPSSRSPSPPVSLSQSAKQFQERYREQINKDDAETAPNDPKLPSSS